MTIINQATSWQDLPPLLTTAEVCALFRVSPRTVDKWVENGDLRRVLLGNAWKYPKQIVRNLAENANADPWEE